MARKTPSVVLATRRELRELDVRKPGIAKSALAATALAMARELDDQENTASGMAACARVFDSTMAALRLQAREARERPTEPPPKESDGVADLTARIASRRSGS
jgi:hypothetical protein